MKQDRPTETPKLPGARILIVEARFYDALIDELTSGARAVLDAAEAEHEVVTVPGALEVPGAITLAADSADPYDGYVALGVVIRGATSHYDIVAGESARGIMELTLDGLCIGNGILTVDNEEQAWERARRSELDKGGQAARACLTMVGLARRWREEMA
ncbi:MAG: 6,7-dimethyl-8-ribityllumazine synthase [Aestuariivirgaceae bacterium]